MSAITLQTVLDAIAKEGFRDLADYDYISARICYRFNLREQFYWSALQAVEKYLKAILLFNGQKVKDLGHFLKKINKRINLDANVRLALNCRQIKFLDILEEFGNNRYCTRNTAIIGNGRGSLKRTPWFSIF